MVLGTAVKHFSIAATRTMMIIRRKTLRKEKPTGAYDFLVLYDGSDASKHALNEAFKVVDKEKDRIHVVTFDNDGSMQSHKATVEKILKDGGIKNGDYKIVQSIGDTIVTAVTKYFGKEDTLDYDFVVLGSKGTGMVKKMTAEYLGSVAEKVITSAKTNLILVVK